MGFYVVVEGEKAATGLYSSWISHLRPELERVHSFSELNANSFYIVAGKGCPEYNDVIQAAVEDVYESDGEHHLVVAVDSEDLSREERLRQVEEVIHDVGYRVQYSIIIQHFCMETWALGNRIMIRPNPHSSRLREFKDIHDVSILDPEDLPVHRDFAWNRSQFAFVYLKEALKERGHRLSYSKSNSAYIADRVFFDRVVSRYEGTGHIDSFGVFLEVFSN